MKLHEPKRDTRGQGRWDRATGRYVPVTGGSRSRLPIKEDPEIPRYYGFIGMDEKYTESIDTMSALYHTLGGAPEVVGGKAGQFTTLLTRTNEEMKQAEEEQLAEMERPHSQAPEE